ncbi:TIR domain-containing protein [Pseudomonas denitrificans (nom. rej.)]|uniref:TIR domain-containing protein n=1 Tax=Pseudomonas denitrificans TaxID=43306 RepID=A0A9X7N124_PSEDE|nr:TIR domain-containing protein [Pseudomonas denitrificans (nom. rej.)]QEY73066.1 TIR domain-containing protein [Pseudomonas denitrificans (nom. rej.)]
MRVFVSYTQRDGLVTREKLELLNSHLKTSCTPFIHLIHGEKAKYQQANVILNIIKSKAVLLVKSPETTSSPWVKLELSIAKKLSIPILEISIEDIDNKDKIQKSLLSTQQMKIKPTNSLKAG